MGNLAIRRGNDIEKNKKINQEQQLLDAQELAVSMYEEKRVMEDQILDLQELVISLVEGDEKV